eukprot:TRINITY_DN9516_c0_g1_i1.p1 TRINITY_DN9516_c0_g1~~TRINITY_DN9516_c0_g1_i1.p1  ORF type:complete len:230 (-),score=44.70 TRINITY_DN9516_c0_g1_i1:66-755(-)
MHSVFLLVIHSHPPSIPSSPPFIIFLTQLLNCLGVSFFLFHRPPCTLSSLVCHFVFWLEPVATGISIGSAGVVAPMYVTEIAPVAVRGTLVSLFQLSTTFFIFLAYLVGYLLVPLGPALGWKWMFAACAVPAIALLFISVFVLPKSPAWPIPTFEEQRNNERRALLSAQEAGKASETDNTAHGEVSKRKGTINSDAEDNVNSTTVTDGRKNKPDANEDEDVRYSCNLVF